MADGAPRAADVSFDKPAAQKREGKVIKKAPAKPKSERDADAAKAKEAARVAAREKAAVCDLCGNQISVASRTCSMAWSFHAIDATSHPRAACVRWRGGARRSPYPNSLVDFPHRRPRPPRKLKLRPRPPRRPRRARRAPPRRPRRRSPRRLLRPPRARPRRRRPPRPPRRARPPRRLRRARPRPRPRPSRRRRPPRRLLRRRPPPPRRRRARRSSACSCRRRSRARRRSTRSPKPEKRRRRPAR